MLKLILLAVLAVLLLLNQPQHAFSADLPDPALTPGANDPEVVSNLTVEQVCAIRTSDVRNVTQSMKRKIFAAYNMEGNDRTTCKEGYEIDHLCSLELGCNNSLKNLWPQSYCGEWNAHLKDRLEDELADMVCAGEVPLEEAQKAISTDWIKAYQKYIGDN